MGGVYPNLGGKTRPQGGFWGATTSHGVVSSSPRVVKPLEHRLRPRGLGLGAEPAPPGPPRAGQPPRGGEEPGGGGLAVGAAVRIEAGPHRDMYGKVREPSCCQYGIQGGVLAPQYGLGGGGTGSTKPPLLSPRPPRWRGWTPRPPGPWFA